MPKPSFRTLVTCRSCSTLTAPVLAKSSVSCQIAGTLRSIENDSAAITFYVAARSRRSTWFEDSNHKFFDSFCVRFRTRASRKDISRLVIETQTRLGRKPNKATRNQVVNLRINCYHWPCLSAKSNARTVSW